MLETTNTKILEKRLAGWQRTLYGESPRRFFTAGECERAIADIQRELQRRAERTGEKP